MLSFAGYHRPDGRIGVRNRLLVLSVGGLTGPVARRIAAGLRDAACVVLPFEAGLIGQDKRVHDRAALGLAAHPNIGAALVVGDNAQVLAALSDQLGACHQPHVVISMDDCDNDVFRMQEAGLRQGARLIHQISRQRRAPAPLSALVLGLECGRSDPSSGIAANPLLGRVADRLIDQGGTAILGETVEWLGAEHLLAARARSTQTGDAISAAVARREAEAMAAGVDLLGRNPTPTNIAAGLSTIEEKSLGSVAKSGTQPVEGMLDYAQTPPHPGLWVMDAPAFAPESLTGFVAAGAQLILFTTGVGNSYVSALAPTLKVSANPDTCTRLSDQIDLRADTALLGGDIPAPMVDAVLGQLAQVASGDLTWGEILGEGDEVVSRFGAAL